ncbi:MAG: hypothetical protein AB7O57_11910, partial [Hyphomicrobiaceae bacterium]
LPGWLYRISLKSTAWFWLPLIWFGVFLLTTPRAVEQIPELLEREVLHAKWPRVLRWMSLATLLVFVGHSSWVWYQSHGLPSEATPKQVLAFMIVLGGLAAVPWQTAGIASNVLSWVVYFTVDKARITREVARDEATLGRARRRLSFAHKVAWLGMICTFAYWLGLAGWVALHANGERCFWHPVTVEQQMWIERIFGPYAPPPPVCPPVAGSTGVGRFAPLLPAR